MAEGPDRTERPDQLGETTGIRSHPVEPAAAPLRASDTERHQVAELLGEHASVGRLTLAELEERVALAYAATTRGQLAELTRDLPDISEPRQQRKVSRWFLAIMGGSKWRGRRRLSGAINMVAIMGGDDIDLRQAEIEGSELVVNVFALMGGPTIYVPDSIEVELSGPAIMGGNTERGSARRPRPGAPLIRIRSFSIMGGVTLWRLPAEARDLSLREARRAAKALERGT